MSDEANERTNANDKPPSYNSIMARLQAAKGESKNPMDFSQKLCSVVCGSVIFTIVLVISSALPLAMLIIGAVNINNCDKLQPKIPVWLVVSGACGVVSALFSAAGQCWENIQKRRDENYKLNRVFRLKSLIDLFLFAWSIAGSVWVYSVYQTKNLDNPLLPNYCDRTCYLFAFAMLTIGWSFIGLACLCCLCCIPIFLCMGCFAAAAS